MASSAAKSDRPAKASEIRNIVGPVDDYTVASILRTGAGRMEVLQAFERQEEDEYIGAGPDGLEGRIKLVYDILRGDRELFGNDAGMDRS